MDSKTFEIDVKGEVEVLLPAERAVLSVKLDFEDLEKAKATDEVIASARKVCHVIHFDLQKPSTDMPSPTSR